MAFNPNNLILGPGDLYAAAFGATEPIDTAFATPPESPDWTDVGGTQDGVNFAQDMEFTQLEVDQTIDAPESRCTKREFKLTTNLAEVTLENIKIASNGGTITAAGTGATSHKKYEPDTDVTSGTRPNYAALIFDGPGPSGLQRRFVGRKMLQVGNVEFAYHKEDQTVLTCEFLGHAVSRTVKPFYYIDEVEVTSG
jgi:hypothetical protein